MSQSVFAIFLFYGKGIPSNGINSLKGFFIRTKKYIFKADGKIPTPPSTDRQ